jgi:hypothetical protein
MFVVLLLVAALAPCLAVLAVLGHGPARRLQLSRYVLLSCASWLAASVCLFAMASLLSGSSGSATDLPIVREPRAFIALAAVCLPAFTLVGSVLYCWGNTWSRERHVVLALLVSLATAVFGIPLLLISTCVIQGNCL